MTNSPKLHAYLVAASRKREASYVYVVLVVTADDALMTVATAVAPRSKLEIVGSLSRDLVKRLRLKPGEMRQV